MELAAPTPTPTKRTGKPSGSQRALFRDASAVRYRQRAAERSVELDDECDEAVVDAEGTLTLDAPGFEPVGLDTASLEAANDLYLASKRVLDVLLALVGLVIAAPIWLAVAVRNRFTDGGPLFYAHPRVGEGGREFTCYKLRSMRVGADLEKAALEPQSAHVDHRTFKIPNDPRVTPLGRFLRRTSLDETPQLLNVLRGEMSIVGPRPPVPAEVERYTLRDLDRLSVKPGLTCIWQVSGRSRIPFPQQLEMDLDYIRNRSLLLDLQLIARTFRAVVTSDGAY